VVSDLNAWFGRLVQENDPHFRHTLEGPDDMPAHIRAALTATQLSIPVMNGRLVLGTWQGIYVFEHRRSPHKRTVAVHFMGD
jgi:secondary thiamine-phosphate synthase enzyme